MSCSEPVDESLSLFAPRSTSFNDAKIENLFPSRRQTRQNNSTANIKWHIFYELIIPYDNLCAFFILLSVLSSNVCYHIAQDIYAHTVDMTTMMIGLCSIEKNMRDEKIFTPIMLSSLVFIDTPSHHRIYSHNELVVVVVRHRWRMSMMLQIIKISTLYLHNNGKCCYSLTSKSIIMMENTNSISLQHFSDNHHQVFHSFLIVFFTEIISIDSHFHYLLLFYL